MAQAVTVYRWDDPGAPQLTNAKPTELLTIIRKCCVDGYGSKSSLGWNILQDDGTLLAMRNSIPDGGSGSIVQFRAHSDSDSSGNIIYIKGAAAFNGVDDLIRPSYQKALQAKSDWTAWILVGTPTAFYFVCGHPTDALAEGNDRVNDVTIFVGDIKSYIQADVGRFTVVSGTDSYDVTTTYSLSWQYHWDRAVCSYSSVSPTIGLWGYDGGNSKINYYIRPPFCDTASQAPSSTPCEYFQPFLITQNSNEKTNRGHLSIRGEMPGLVSPIWPFQATEAWPSFVDINGKQHLAIRGVRSSVKSYINIEEW